MQHWDYIIVGAGSAGCGLADELVRSGKTVLILEAGGWDRGLAVKFFAGVRQAMARYDWGYRSQPDPSRNGISEKWIRGRVVGGSSTINGMIYVRGAAADFDRWAQHCGQQGGWSARDIIPLFVELEGSDQSGSLRGRHGPLHVNTVKRPHPISNAFIESAQAAGLAFNQDYNDRSQEGVGYIQRTIHRGLRCSAADAFLKPLLSRGNLQLRLNALVEKIEVSGGRATAVRFTQHGKSYRETARDIILCAGSINSPQLLMLSGIGAAEELKRHDIEVVLNRPEVGRNLKEQPVVRLVCRSRIPTYNLTGGLPQKIGLLWKFLRHREGPLAGGYESMAFVRTRRSELVPDVMLYFAPIGYVGKVGGAGALAEYPGIMMIVAKIYPASNGSIRLASRDPAAAPVIDCRLLAEQADVDTLVRGIDTARDLIRRNPIAGLIDSEVMPGAALANQQSLREFVRSHADVSMHPSGTCRMGVDEGAVVGPDLRVRGTENLWIADASIMPDHVSANLNAVCIMIGKKLGKQLVARARVP